MSDERNELNSSLMPCDMLDTCNAVERYSRSLHPTDYKTIYDSHLFVEVLGCHHSRLYRIVSKMLSIGRGKPETKVSTR